MKKLLATVFAAIFLLMAAAGTAAAWQNGGAGYPWHHPGSFEPRVAFDLNPDPRIVEVVLVARIAPVEFEPGVYTEVWTYNGGIPGPTIEAEVGDTLIVHFFNLLPEETTVHWHGLESPADMDGSNIAQLAVEPHGYFRYELPLLQAATYWYHPHIRVAEQVEKGLYGALVVRDPQEDDDLGLPDRDKVVVLDDILLDENGQVADPLPADPVERAKTLLNGREGNTLLVNGRPARVLDVPMGRPQRWRVINTSNARFMRISIPGHTMYRIGGDGGLLEHPLALPEIPQIEDPESGPVSDPDPDKGLLLSVAERADVVFTPMGRFGQLIPVQWHDFPRGLHETFLKPDGTIGFQDSEEDGKRPPRTLMYLRLVGFHHGGEYIPPDNLRVIDPIDSIGAAPLKVIFGHTPPDENGNVTFFAATDDYTLPPAGGIPTPFDAVTPAIAQDVFVGETRVWEITNLTGGDHPFHAHGWFFQPIEVQYFDMDNPANNRIEPFPFLEEKDTVRVPKRPGAAGRSRTVLRAVVRFDDEGREGRVAASGKDPTAEEGSGGWVFHCHINEHSEVGMMSFIEVFEPEL